MKEKEVKILKNKNSRQSSHELMRSNKLKFRRVRKMGWSVKSLSHKHGNPILGSRAGWT